MGYTIFRQTHVPVKLMPSGNRLPACLEQWLGAKGRNFSVHRALRLQCLRHFCIEIWKNFSETFSSQKALSMSPWTFYNFHYLYPDIFRGLQDGHGSKMSKLLDTCHCSHGICCHIRPLLPPGLWTGDRWVSFVCSCLNFMPCKFIAADTNAKCLKIIEKYWHVYSRHSFAVSFAMLPRSSLLLSALLYQISLGRESFKPKSPQWPQRPPWPQFSLSFQPRELKMFKGCRMDTFHGLRLKWLTQARPCKTMWKFGLHTAEDKRGNTNQVVCKRRTYICSGFSTWSGETIFSMNFPYFSWVVHSGPIGCQVAAGAAGSVQIGLGNILWVPQAWQSRPDDWAQVAAEPLDTHRDRQFPSIFLNHYFWTFESDSFSCMSNSLK